ncbi:very large A-kinase anchor protein [Zootoca vivipara]|uniref:very large A-kinase anchor protein n=1 Tax=Zootoca vivipara TaxID=8524 RepID=UPI00293C0229|nr:very large A-kinase anchor protein [Zootoca vivipara]
MSGGSSRRRSGSSWHSSFSRLFSRSPSKEQESAGRAAAAAAPPQQPGARSLEIDQNECTSVAFQRKQSTPLPELLKISVCDSKNLSTEELSRSTTQEELKKANSLPSLVHEGKNASNDRQPQPKEGFFQYLGSLFGIASKSSYKETEHSNLGDGCHRTGKDFASPASHQEGGHADHQKPEIFVISTPGGEQTATNKEEQANFVKSTSPGSQDLQKAQEQSAEASKKTECELGAPAVTYATYRGSARIKQLLKKQAELEQEKQTPTSINSTTVKNKENRTVSLPNSETTTTKTESSLKTNSGPKTKDDTKDSQANIFLAEMDFGGNSLEVLGNCEQKELKNKITSLTEMETIKNCIEELVSVKHTAVSNTPELNRNLLLEPTLLQKKANFSCQNTDAVSMSSENSRLLKNREEVLGEIQMEIQSINATTVGFQKGMQFCPFSTTETKETMQKEFFSHPKVDLGDNEQHLLENKCPCNSWTEDQFKLKAENQTLHLNSIIGSGQAVSRVESETEESYQKMTEQEKNMQIISPDGHLPLHEQKVGEELQLVLQDTNCKKGDISAGVGMLASVQSKEMVQDADIFGKSDLKSEEATEFMVLTDIPNNHNFPMMSENGTNNFTTDNLYMPVTKFDHVRMTGASPNAAEGNHANTSLLAAEYENVVSRVASAALETGDTSTEEAVGTMDGAPLILGAKDDNCHISQRAEDETLIETSTGLESPLPLAEDKTKPIKLENSELKSNTGTTTVAKPIPSLLKTAEVVISAQKTDPLVDEIKNQTEAKMACETKEDITIGLPPAASSKETCLPEISPPVVKSEENSYLPFPPSPLRVLVGNSFISGDSKIILDPVSKPVLNSEDHSLLGALCSLADKQDCTNQSLSDSAGTINGKICCSAYTCENNQVISKSEDCGPGSRLIAAESGCAGQVPGTFLESESIPETKITFDTAEIADSRSEILLRSEEMKNMSASCLVDSRSNLAKEDLLVSTIENLYTFKPVSPITCFKDSSKFSSPACETSDFVLDKNHALPVDSEEKKGKVLPKYKPNTLHSQSVSETDYPVPFLSPVACDVEATEPVKIVLGSSFTTQQRKEEQRTSCQRNLHYLAVATTSNTVEMGDQAITTLFTESSSQFSEEALSDVETGRQVQIKSQDLTVLLKKADEIVDAVLRLAIEEIRSKQAAGVCQTNDIKDNLLGLSLQKDQKNRKILSESKEMQSRNSSLKHFNEGCIRKLSEVKAKDTLGTNIKDEKIPFDITDKIDLHSSIALKAKEIIDDVINSAIQKVTYNQPEDHLSNGILQNSALKSNTEASKKLTTDTELTAKLPKIIEESLNLSPIYGTSVCNIISDGKVANSSASSDINIKDDRKEITGGEQKNEIDWSDPSATVECSPPIVNGKNSKHVNCTMCMTDAGEETKWTIDDESEYSSYSINEDTVMDEVHLPSFGPLDSLGNNVGKNLPEYVFKEGDPAEVVREEPREKYYEIESEKVCGKMTKTYTVPQNAYKFGTQFSMSEQSVMNSSAKIGLNSDFSFEEEAVVETGLTVLKEYYRDDDDDCGNGEKSPKLFAASAPEVLDSSSFIILYEGALQDESYFFSTEEPDHPLSSLPDQSLDNNQHFLMCETVKGKLESVHPCEQSNQLNNLSSEAFVTVEAKRFSVYPFSLSPIYEDDSSQEDLLSAEVSPEGNPIERANQSLSVLSLLQSVSERLRSSSQCNEEEEESICEENKLEDEKEAYLSSQGPNSSCTAVLENIHERTYSHFLSKEALNAEETLSLSSMPSAQLLQKSDRETSSSSKSIYYESLQSSRTCSSEKGTRFRNVLVPKDQQPESSALQRPAAFQVCPVGREGLKCNPRPGKMVICDVHGNTIEIYHDVIDATAWVFSKEALIRVVRGCWIMYEKPGFLGEKYVLEEGEEMLNDLLNPHSEKHQKNFRVGSIRQVVKDCSVPEIELYPQDSTDHVPVCIQSAVANLEELEVKPHTLFVKAGVWIAYSDINYKGEVMVLEENHSPCEISAADVKSLHPLKMGGLKVQMPMNIKMIIYETPYFGGWHKELSENTDCFPNLFENPDDFQGIGSIRVIGGIWVAYERERYKGQQYLLEEGEFEDWKSWGGVRSVLLSFRFLQADFMESAITLFETDEENGKSLDISNQEVPDLEQAGFGPVTRSVNVKSGVWVAYQQKFFCGEQYILEKGKYKCFFDWGGSSETIMSIRPIKLEPLGNLEPKHWLKAFSSTHFKGSCIDVTREVAGFASFTPCSFKVLRGCWLLHYQGETAEDQCVLEEDLYPDLTSCGCPAAAVKSLKPLEYVFAEPLISLFALENCEGRELHLQEAVSSVLNKDLHFLTQSMWVKSGLWIAYEGCNFLGKQLLLEPSKISNWTQFSGWKVIGSLRPVKQPAVYFRIKNRSLDKYLTVTGNLMDARATSLCLSALNGKTTQIWRYCSGLLKSKVNDACLDVIGGRDVPGAKVALWVEHGKARQKWMLNKDGTVSSYLSDQLVLDIKGGYYYDKNHIVVNQLDARECTQIWVFEIL